MLLGSIFIVQTFDSIFIITQGGPGQATTTLQLITRAEASGHTRHAANLRRVQANLEKIIPALEALDASTEEGHDDSSCRQFAAVVSSMPAIAS